MSHSLSTEAQVKDVLKIDSFRNLSKAKVMEFVNTIPMMDRELAVDVIKQFPEYTKSSNLMLSELRGMCDVVLASNQDGKTEVVRAYQIVLEECQKMLNDESLSEESKLEVADKMVTIATRISCLDDKNKAFLNDVWKDYLSVVKFLSVGMLILLGVNVKWGRIIR